MSKMVFAYIVCGNEKEALKIGEKLVDTKLCACVNILPDMRSIYRWKGKLVKDKEVVLIAKTADKKFKALQKEVRRLHSYDVPCILELKVSNGNKEYLDWLKANLA